MRRRTAMKRRFLYADEPRPDDVIAEDFLDKPDEWAFFTLSI